VLELLRKKWIEDNISLGNFSFIELYRQWIFDILNVSWESEIIEVLSRWFVDNHLFLPDSFIPMIEKSNQNKDFDLFIISKVVDYIKKWYINQDVIVHVNVYPDSFASDWFVKNLEVIFSWFDASNLVFEILENWTITEKQYKIVNKTISLLRNKFWIICWLDDYPNWNNNNEMLWRLKEISFVKIDKQFLLEQDLSDENLINTIEGLVLNIREKYPDVRIVIEWVESRERILKVLERVHDITLIQWNLYWEPKQIINNF